MTELG